MTFIVLSMNVSVATSITAQNLPADLKKCRITLIFVNLDRLLVPKRQLFMVFSVYTNGRSLLSCKKSTSKDVMHCVHGIRVISTQWVVLGHTYVLYMTMPTANTFQFMGHVSEVTFFALIASIDRPPP